jgi:hypothetical protein
MRHILLSDAITPTALRVRKPPTPARLVTPACLAHALAPRRPRAMPSAINLPAITVTANQCLRTTQRTHKDPSRRFHRRPTSRQSDIDRDPCFVEYSPRTRAQHGVGHDIGVNLAVWAGVVPALLGSGLFTSSRRALSGAPADSVPSAQPTPKVLPTHLGSALHPSPPDLRGFAPPFTLHATTAPIGSTSTTRDVGR